MILDFICIRNKITLAFEYSGLLIERGLDLIIYFCYFVELTLRENRALGLGPISLGKRCKVTETPTEFK